MNSLLCWPDAILMDAVRVIYTGQPLPKERPAGTPKGWIYSEQRVGYYERCLRSLLLAARAEPKADNRSAFGLRCRFYRMDLVKVEVESLLACVRAAARGVIWSDDAQLVEVCARVFRAQLEPSAEVVIYRVKEND